MLSFDEARVRLRSAVGSLDSHRLPIVDAIGHVVATPIVAERRHPPVAVSSMDGYAARASDLPAALPVAIEIPAGAEPPPLPPGAAARIFTGAPLPAGADCVVRQEVTERAGEDVTLPATPVGQFVRPGGDVFDRDDVVMDAGGRLSAAGAGLAAVAGLSTIDVVRPPRCDVVVTGGELVDAGEHARGSEIYDANGPMLSGLLTQSTGIPPSVARVRDELGDVVAALGAAAARADVVVTSGGVSVGDHDLVPAALAELGADVVVHGIRLKPGKPVLVARTGATWFVGLPGNPVSALVGWRLFADPICRRLAGDERAFDLHLRHAPLLADHDNRGDRLMMRPARLDVDADGPSLSFMRWKGSHDLRGAAAANVLVRLEPGQAVASGDRVPYLHLTSRRES